MGKSIPIQVLRLSGCFRCRHSRGHQVQDTGNPISVPVGKNTLGRLFDVLGNTIDGKGIIKNPITLPIHRSAPKHEDLTTEAEILVTGIKVVDLMEPYT